MTLHSWPRFRAQVTLHNAGATLSSAEFLFILPMSDSKLGKIRFVSTGENHGKPCLICNKHYPKHCRHSVGIFSETVLVFIVFACELIKSPPILTFKVPIATASRRQFFFLYFSEKTSLDISYESSACFRENKSWKFMSIVCQADDTNEMSRLIFSEKNDKKI